MEKQSKQAKTVTAKASNDSAKALTPKQQLVAQARKFLVEQGEPVKGDGSRNTSACIRLLLKQDRWSQGVIASALDVIPQFVSNVAQTRKLWDK